MITLGIIGIVAAIIVPGVIENYQEKAQIVALKQAYSQINNAIKLAAFEEGPINTWGVNTEERIAAAQKILPKYLKVVKHCPKGIKGCQGKTYTCLAKETIGGSTKINIDGYYDAMLLANGYSIQFGGSGYTCTKDLKSYNNDDIQSKAAWGNHCFAIYVDVNGPKKPNTSSVDYFSFIVLQDGIAPLGTNSTHHWSWAWNLSFNNQCLQQSPYGVPYMANCTAWVLTYENMDYKRCPEKLGWDNDKKKSCK